MCGVPAVALIDVEHDLRAVGRMESSRNTVEGGLIGGIDSVEHATKLVI